MPGIPWQENELARLARLTEPPRTRGDWRDLARDFPGRTEDALRVMYHKVHEGIPQSPYPTYDAPLRMRGDALVLNDLEAPFHHAGFTNNCLSLAREWKIKQLILGGDFLHMDALSGFEPAWVTPSDKIPEKAAQKLIEALKELPAKKRDRILDSLGVGEMGEPNYSEEMQSAEGVLKAVGRQFDKVCCILGNHEGRLLRMLKTPLFPDEVLKQVRIEAWEILPYYHCILESGGEEWRITHPKNLAKASAWKLAAKYQQHIIMAHNHQQVVQFDPSAKFWAIESGCGVDEERLPYVAQRDNVAHKHVLGAVIVRDGYPWVLNERSDWDRLARAV